MKALMVTAPGAAEVIEVPRPAPQIGEVLVRVSQCNTCPQWDLHLAANEPMFVGHQFHYPYTLGQPGHEMVGTVEAVGDGVVGFDRGAKVAAWRDAGHQRQGCYAEYVAVAAENLLLVPDHLADSRVASLELAMCVAVSVLPLLKLDAIAGQSAAVNGLGPAGLIAAQMLRAEGAASVVGFEPNLGRREAALGWAVDAACDPREPATAEQFPDRGRIEVAIDCVGFPAAVRWLMDRVRRHVALFAVQRHDYTYALGHAGLTVIGYEGHHRAAAEYALGLIVAGKVDLAPLVSVELPFERYVEGVELLRRQEACKIGFRW
jgi:threonine dehydrogenase-like Zn-dependent dehydrogenase